MKRAALFLTLVMAGLVILVRPSKAAAAMLYFSPSTKTVTVGTTLAVTLKVNTAGQAINGSEGTITFNSEVLRLTAVTTTGSIFEFWPVQPSGNNTSGQITYSGGLANPGYNGTNGTILTLTFQAITVATDTIAISGAKVLANDGQGTDVLTDTGRSVITVTPAASSPLPVPPVSTDQPAPTLSSRGYPDQTAWYQADQATLNWTKPSGVTGFSFRLSQDAAESPDQSIETVSTSTIVVLPTDGQWFFSLRAQYPSGWSPTTRWRLQHDHTAPEAFTISIDRDRGLTDPTPQLVFATKDATSGVTRYMLSIDGGTAEETSSPALLSNVLAGQHTVIITAFDRANNSTSSSVSVDIIGYPAPILDSVTSPLLLLDPLIVKGWANAGDTITVYGNSHVLGQTVAGKPVVDETVTVRVPWIVRSESLLRPGQYHVTAIARSDKGLTSVASDPVPLLVSGHSIILGGRRLATFAVAGPLAVGVLGLGAIIIAWFVQMFLSLKRLHRNDLKIEHEIGDVRRQLRRGRVSTIEVDEKLENIERELLQAPRRTRSRRGPLAGRPGSHHRT